MREKPRELIIKVGINVNEIKLHTTCQALLKPECTKMIKLFVG